MSRKKNGQPYLNDKICQCGCGVAFKTPSGGRKYFENHGHLNRARKAIEDIKSIKYKICIACNLNKPVEKFYLKNEFSSALNINYSVPRSKCIICHGEDTKNWAVNNRDRHNFHHQTHRNKFKDDFNVWLLNKVVYFRTKSKKENLSFDLDADFLNDLYMKQDGKCSYSGEILLFQTRRENRWKSISLDRISPEKGYVKGNVVWCTYRINTMKSNLPLSEFYDTIEKILERRDENGNETKTP